MCALLGGLPLALGNGTGSELRKPLGISIVGGLIVSQVLTLYTTPVVYLYMDRVRCVLRKTANMFRGSRAQYPRKRASRLASPGTAIAPISKCSGRCFWLPRQVC